MRGTHPATRSTTHMPSTRPALVVTTPNCFSYAPSNCTGAGFSTRPKPIWIPLLYKRVNSLNIKLFGLSHPHIPHYSDCLQNNEKPVREMEWADCGELDKTALLEASKYAQVVAPPSCFGANALAQTAVLKFVPKKDFALEKRVFSDTQACSSWTMTTGDEWRRGRTSK